MKLSITEVEHIATLARLSLTAKEKEQYAKELSAIFDFFETLNEVDTSNVLETNQVTGLKNIVREDVVKDTSEETRKKLIDAFPEKLGNLLKVKGVF